MRKRLRSREGYASINLFSGVVVRFLLGDTEPSGSRLGCYAVKGAVHSLRSHGIPACWWCRKAQAVRGRFRSSSLTKTQLPFDGSHVPRVVSGRSAAPCPEHPSKTRNPAPQSAQTWSGVSCIVPREVSVEVLPQMGARCSRKTRLTLLRRRRLRVEPRTHQFDVGLHALHRDPCGVTVDALGVEPEVHPANRHGELVEAG